MKNAFLIILFFVSGSVFAQEQVQKTTKQVISGFEFHASVNHPLSTKSNMRTFYGGGFGANMLFRSSRPVSFKTGVEFNYFHTWDESVYAGHLSGQTNIHYQYAVVSIPAIVRFDFGKKFKLFAELGGYLGIPVGGSRRADYSSYDPYNGTIFKGIKHESYTPGLSVSPTIGLGGRFPLSERIDLLLKPEFTFVISELDADSNPDFNKHFFYGRFCAGIHLKHRKK
ncbi:hypothetical protein D3C87_308360 [compost metagenome]